MFHERAPPQPNLKTSPMESPLRKEFDWYLENQGGLVKQYNGKHVVIKDRRVLGAYATAIEAVTETEKTEPLGTFLVQKVEPGSDAYTQTFYSRVAVHR